MRMVKILAFALVFCCSVVAQQQRAKDSTEAIKIAEKALTRIYGTKQIESERPLNAKLEGDVWIITGTLHCKDSRGNDTQDCVGGVAQARVSKVNGRILSVTHTK